MKIFIKVDESILSFDGLSVTLTNVEMFPGLELYGRVGGKSDSRRIGAKYERFTSLSNAE